MAYLRDVGRRYARRLKAAIREGEGLRGVRRITRGGNVVAEVDLVAEGILEDTVRERGVPVILVTEDRGARKVGAGSPEYVLVADPLDGTTNFRRGIPFFGFSLALAKPTERPTLSDVFAGLVMDLCHDELFTGRRPRAGTGGHVAVPGKLVVSLYAYGARVDPRYFRLYPHLIVRGMGSLALEICYVARGRIDAVMDVRGIARAVDVAGAIPVLEEAGGVITDLDGKGLDAELDAVPRISFVAARSDAVRRRLMRLI